MKRLSFKSISGHLLLCVFLSLHWGVTDCTTVSESSTMLTATTPGTTPATTPATTQPPTTLPTTLVTTSATTKPPPVNVKNVTVVTQTVSSVTLMWDKVNDVSTYILKYENNGLNMTENIPASSNETVRYVVYNLTAARKYNFTLLTVSEGVSSTGYTFPAVTAPNNPEEFKSVGQNETSITLQWRKVSDIHTYVLVFNDSEINVTDSEEPVTHTVSDLTSGTRYSFSLFTVFENVRSSGVNQTAVTAPENVKNVTVVAQNVSSVTLGWDKVDDILNYVLLYEENGLNMTENITASPPETSVQRVVSNLSAARKYNFTLFTVFEGVSSTGYTFPAVTAPHDSEEFKIIGQNETSITLQWKKVSDIHTYVLVFNDSEINVTDSEESVTHTVSDLTSGTRYSFSLFTVFEHVRSSGVNQTAVTAPENVKNVTVVAQNVSSVTLGWDKVGDISTYVLLYEENGLNVTKNITASPPETSVQRVVSNLSAARKYSFTLFTVFEGVSSTGRTFSAVTAPENVRSVTVQGQNESSITLTWQKVDGVSTYMLLYEERGGDVVKNIIASDEREVQYVVSPLTSGTKYHFTLFSVFEGVNSTGSPFSAVTAPDNVKNVTVVTQTVSSITLMWDKVSDTSTYVIKYEEDGRSVEEDIPAPAQGSSVQHVVSPLTAARKYNFTLITVFEKVNSTGRTFPAVTAPHDPEEFKVLEQTETSITLQWKTVPDIHTYVLVVDEREMNVTGRGELVRHTVSDLTSGTRYSFRLFAVFENVRSSGKNETAITAPTSVKNVTVMAQNESSITLMWQKVNDTSTYILKYEENGKDVVVNITASAPGSSVEHVVSPLTAGTKYNFTLITVFDKVNSAGHTFDAATSPPVVPLVNVTERFASKITLRWENANKNWGYLIEINGSNTSVIPDASNTVLHPVTPLNPGTVYDFRVFTVFSGLLSADYKGITVTAIDCDAADWRVTTSSIEGTIEGLFSNATASNKSESHVNGNVRGNNVSFSGLYPGDTYEISLVYDMNGTTYLQCERRKKITIIPPDLMARCEYWGAGYSAYIVWDRPNGVWTTVEVNVTGKSEPVHGYEQQHVVISGLQPAKTYEVSVSSLSEGVRNYKPHVFYCETDPRGVIAGSVFGVLLFLLLVCLAVFVFLKRPDIISRKKSFIGGSKLSKKKDKAISVTKFPDHFSRLGLDDNRGFSQEYEALLPVGTNQTRKVSTLPENKVKNRFNNVLPYDWCRVKLTTTNHSNTTDYINASYMPGYNSNREYIATQGPLPSTVSDFWRMVWEQRVKGIVMVTNCTESGRTKCEQYWPTDSKPRQHGELVITMRSEKEEPNWTLRDFTVKHTNTSEERTVKHFHFTAWPDHGVPQGTKVLIQFREIVRQHIQREGARAPTVVHCSAGVGRTGTIIALDVLLQQLEKEKAVGINTFVHKMRLNRPHMVQTESQYVFLHQCIMDRLQWNERNDENIYENADMIYANATALRELHNA